KLDTFYREHEQVFDEDQYAALLDRIFTDVLSFEQLYNGPLMKPYQMYSLMLALVHINYGPVQALQKTYPVNHPPNLDHDRQLYRLSELSSALEDSTGGQTFGDFIRASEKGTNSISQRETRFRWM